MLAPTLLMFPFLMGQAPNDSREQTEITHVFLDAAFGLGGRTFGLDGGSGWTAALEMDGMWRATEWLGVGVALGGFDDLAPPPSVDCPVACFVADAHYAVHAGPAVRVGATFGRASLFAQASPQWDLEIAHYPTAARFPTQLASSFLLHFDVGGEFAPWEHVSFGPRIWLDAPPLFGLGLILAFTLRG